MPDRKITRRTMVRAAAGAAAGTGLRWPLEAAGHRPGIGLLGEVWDAHGHLSGPGLAGTPEERVDRLLRFADRMGIQRLIVFMGYPMVHDPSPEEIRRQNDLVLRAVRHAADRVLGFVYVNPRHPEASLAELDRCVARGPMVGVKLWVALRCADARLDPIVRRAVELKVPILQHTWLKATGNLPGESTPEDLAQLASRHPEATFLAAHVGGQWERGIRAIRAAANVVAEICGSDPTAGFVEMAVRELGPHRVVYGSDFAGRSFASQLAKVLGADLPDSAKRLVLGGNIRRILAPVLAAQGAKP